MAFTVVDLVPSSVAGSGALAVNATGTVVGTRDGSDAFVWIPNQPGGTTGTAQTIPVFGPLPTGLPAECVAAAVNGGGDVVGSCETVDPTGAVVSRAFLFNGAALADLGTLIGAPGLPGLFLGNSAATGINDSGQVVGWSDTVSGVRHAFRFDPATGMHDLGSILSAGNPGLPDASSAAAINNAGVVVGKSAALDAVGSVVDRAFALAPGAVMADLGTLRPDAAGGFLGDSEAFAVNAAGQPVGTSDAAPPVVGGPLQLATAFLFPPAPVVGPNPGTARGINDAAGGPQIVGHFVTVLVAVGPRTSGFVQDPTNGVADLNTQLATPDWTITTANGINDAGQIAAVGTHVTLGGPRAVLLVP